MKFFPIFSSLVLSGGLIVSYAAFADSREGSEWLPTTAKQFDNPKRSLRKPMSVDFESFTHEESLSLP